MCLVSRIMTDPESLEKLSQVITTTSHEIKDVVKKLNSTLQATVWDDIQRRSFEKEFQMLIKNLDVFVAQSPTVASYLKKKASQLREYNSR